MDDPADDAPIILSLRPGMDHRKMRSQRGKLFVRQPKVVRHESSLHTDLNHDKSPDSIGYRP
jgi:hypothetical protein